MSLNDQQEQPATDTNFTEDELEKQKLRLENEKLKLEIAELSRPFWRKPAHLCTLFAICSLSVVFVTGQFQANSARLDTEKAILALKTTEFEAKRHAVQMELERAARERESYQAQLDGTAQQLASARQELATARQQLELDSVQRSLNSTQKSISELALSNVRLNKNLWDLAKTPPVKLAPTTISSPGLKTGIKVDPKLLALRSRWTLPEQENLLQPKVNYKPQGILAIK